MHHFSTIFQAALFYCTNFVAWLFLFSSVTQSCLTLCDPMRCSTPGLPVQHQLLQPTQLMPIESVMPSNYLILCHPLLLPSSIFASIRVFSNELVLHIRWPKYWIFSFSTSPSKEYSGFISFRIDWFDLAVQGTLNQESPPAPQLESISSLVVTFFMVQLS